MSRADLGGSGAGRPAGVSPDAARRSHLRLATLNLASGRPRIPLPPDADAPAAARQHPRSLDAEGLEAALSPLGPGGLALDVLALQEVDVDQPRSGHVDQVAVAARALGVDPGTGAAFAPAILGTPSAVRDWSPAPPTVVTAAAQHSPEAAGPMYGIALVTRLPVLQWHVLRMPGGTAKLPLPVQDPTTGRRGVLMFPDEPRVALAAELDAGELGHVTVACTHLSFWPTTAVRQLRMVRRWLADIPGIVVLAGDLNLNGRISVRAFGGDPLVQHPSYPADHPRRQIDHLLLRRTGSAAWLHRQPAGSVLLNVSDHRGLAAVLHR